MPNPQILSVLRQQISAVMQNAGQTATWRFFVSGSAANAEYGLGTAHTYSQRPITGLFDPIRPQEIFTVGGQFMVGDVRLATIEQINKQDEIVWESNRYLSISEPISTNLFGTAMNQTVIRRG